MFRLEGYDKPVFGTAGVGEDHVMRIIVRHPGGDDAGRLKSHADKLLRRVLDRHWLSVDLVQVRLNTLAGAEGGGNSRCRIMIKLLPGGSIRAEASDREAVLALYRAADTAVFLLWQCLKSANSRCGDDINAEDAPRSRAEP